jgi:hypothetical protein
MEEMKQAVEAALTDFSESDMSRVWTSAFASFWTTSTTTGSSKYHENNKLPV